MQDLSDKCERFEKKIYDLELTRTVALQMAPQIRMVQNNDSLMSEKIQSTLVNSLPLWKSQMLIALGLAHSQEAAKAQQMVTDATNQMLIQNAEALHQATVTSAKEYERGIVDMETLEKTQANLINTIDEVIKIQDDGRAKRREAEAKLVEQLGLSLTDLLRDYTPGEDFDRAAPKGMGQYKVAGNYGASLMPAKLAKKAGFPIPLFLDPREHKYIDEFGTSNFLAITKDGKYVTSDSPSILPSVTNMSLMQVARDLGLTVEKRPIVAEEELPTFAEVDACGTAVVITPISSVTIHGKVIEYGHECGPVSQKLYDRLTGIQRGELEDTHGWLYTI